MLKRTLLALCLCLPASFAAADGSKDSGWPARTEGKEVTAVSVEGFKDCEDLVTTDQTRCFSARLKKAEAGLAKAEAERRKAAAEEDRWLRESGPQGYDIQERTAKASAKAWKAFVAAECAYSVAELTTGTLAGVEAFACPARLHEQRIRELGGE